jgi:predicted dehydrogenase
VSTSKGGALLTTIRDLARRRGRERRGLALAEGVRLVEEALAAGIPVRGAAVSPALEGKIGRLFRYANSEQAIQLIEEAARRKRVLMVDHTFVYTGAVRKIRELITANALGDIYYYDAVRVNLGLFQHDVNVIWDLAIHDLSIMDYVLPSKATAVSATGISHIPGQPENVAYITLFFANPQIAHVHVNWLTPVKVRHTLIGGSDKMILYDDLEPSEKVKIYDKGVTVSQSPEAVYEMLVSYRSGDMWAPRLDATEALQTEAQHFIDCIENNKNPETNGQAGLRLVQIVEAAEKSLRARGQLVEIV